MRGRGPQPARGGLTGTRGFGRRPQRRPDQPPVRRRRLRSSRPRGAENLARRPRGSRRRAHRARGLHACHPTRRRLEGPRHGGTLRREHQHSRGSRQLNDGGYPVQTYAAHLGDPPPADPGEDLASDDTWVQGTPPRGSDRREAPRPRSPTACPPRSRCVLRGGRDEGR